MSVFKDEPSNSCYTITLFLLLTTTLQNVKISQLLLYDMGTIIFLFLRFVYAIYQPHSMLYWSNAGI